MFFQSLRVAEDRNVGSAGRSVVEKKILIGGKSVF